MVIMNIPDWLGYILALGFSLFCWSIGLFFLMLIYGTMTDGIKRWFQPKL